MSAETVPSPEQPDPQIVDFMRPFQEQLDQLTNELREAEEQTQTAGWRRSYETANTLHRENVKAFATRLEEAARAIKSDDVSEDLVKEAKEAVKLLNEEYETNVASRRRLIDPIRDKVAELTLLHFKIKRLAGETEEANKLHARGLKDKIVAHLKQYPHALWDEEKGTVTLA